MISTKRLFICACLLAIAHANEESGEGGEESYPPYLLRTSALIVVTLLIIASVLFEIIKDKIEETTSETMSPIIQHLWQELTVLGFLSIITFLLIQIGTQMGNKLSTKLFGEAEKLPEMIEYIHMMLFAMMVIFIIQVLLLVRLGDREQAKWEKYEHLSRSPEKVIDRYQSVMLGRKTGSQFSFIWKLFPLCNPTSQSEEAMNYMLIRNEFIHPRDPTARKLKTDFQLSLYFSFIMGEFLGELVEISPITWMFLEVVGILVYALSYLPFIWFSVAFLILGWLLVVWICFLVTSLQNVKLQLLPRVRAKHIASVNDEESESTCLLEATSAEDPIYLHKPLKRRNKFGERIFGTPANKHERLFLVDRKGPGLYVRLIRFAVILNAIYISALVIMFGVFSYVWIFLDDCGDICNDTSYWPLIMLPLGIFPVFLTAGLFPRLIRLWVIVCNIEMLKRPDVITKVVRILKMKKSLQTIKVIQLMRYNSRRISNFLEDGGESLLQDVPQLSPAKKASIKEVFDLFDKDKSGKISCRELSEVFAALGQPISELEAQELINILDNDGDGELDFEEFCVYLAHTAREDTLEIDELISSMFTIFDKHDKGAIPNAEFAATLKKLGTALTQEEIQAFVEEMDEDGDGSISLEEFESVVRQHLQEEKRRKI